MAKLSLLLSFLLLCVVRLDAVKAPRGVRGSSTSLLNGEDLAGRNSLEVRGRNLQGGDDEGDEDEDAKDKNKDKNKNKDNDDNENQDDDEGEEPDEDEDDDEGEDDDENGPVLPAIETEEPTPEATTEQPVETDAPATDDETEEVTDDLPEETTDDSVTTDAPETGTSPPIEIPTNVTVADPMYSVDLAPFTVEFDYVEKVTEDPGMEEYLFQEMVRGGAYNLNEVNLQVTVSPVYGRRRLVSQVLYYTGAAVFEGAPVYEESQVQGLQNQILSDEEAVAAVIAEFLGEDPSTFVVSSIVVEGAAVDSGSGSDAIEPEDDELSTTGLAIVIIAACIGAVSMTLIVAVALKKPAPHKPYNGANPSRSLKVSSKEIATKEAPKADDEGKPKEDLNKTFDTESDVVHEEFAQNMEKHSFNGSWSKGKDKGKGGPVNMQASVGRGSYEVSSHGGGESEDNSASPEELKKELDDQLSELQASVKAAREKTQKLLDESKEGMKSAS